jgi:pimeloyl-ACP methyl ester carboxylesterase
MGAIISRLAFPELRPSYTADQFPDSLAFVTPHGRPHRVAYRVLDNPGSDTTIFYSHGNFEDLGSMSEWGFVLRSVLNARVVIYDWEGRGASDGKCCETALYADFLAVVLAVTERFIPANLAPSQHKMFFFARSIGTAPSTHIAALMGGMPDRRLAAAMREAPETVATVQKHLCGVMLQSPPASAFMVVSQLAESFPRIPFDQFRTRSKAHWVQVPVLVIHGLMDTIVPFSNGHAVWNALDRAGVAVEPLWLPEAGHNDIEAGFGDYLVTRMKKFVAEATDARTQVLLDRTADIVGNATVIEAVP